MRRGKSTKPHRRRFLEAHVVGLYRNTRVLCQADVLGVSTETKAGASEHLVTRSESSDRLADRFNLPRELHPEYVYFSRSPETHHESHEERICFPHAPVCGTNCGRVNPIQNFLVPGNGLFNLFNLNDIRRPIPAVDSSSHVPPSNPPAANTVLETC